VKVIVLQADGPHFCSGHDLKETEGVGTFDLVFPVAGLDGKGQEAMMAGEEEVYLNMTWRWRNLPKPLLAAAQGKTIAGGLPLLWCADIIIAADDAIFSDPVVAFGVNGVEYFAHPFVMNPRIAKEFLYLGERMSAGRAYEAGMVNRVVPRAELLERTLEIANKLAAQPRFGIALAKRAINQAEDRMGLRDSIDAVYGLHHVAHAHNSLTSPDHLAGQDARSMAAAQRGK
jgi:enoyl-CoA hydratase